jgi:hypothetical protein
MEHCRCCCWQEEGGGSYYLPTYLPYPPTYYIGKYSTYLAMSQHARQRNRVPTCPQSVAALCPLGSYGCRGFMNKRPTLHMVVSSHPGYPLCGYTTSHHTSSCSQAPTVCTEYCNSENALSPTLLGQDLCRSPYPAQDNSWSSRGYRQSDASG